jgi:DNA-binding transcriptional LysR family regulator
LLCASPAYLKTHGVPKHPRDLVDHRCLSFLPTGPEWMFDGPRGRITVQVRPLLSSNEGHVLVKSAIAGNGILYLFEDWLRPHLESGALEPLLERWWLRFSGPFLYYPSRSHMPAALRAFIDFVATSRAPAKK